MTIRGPRPPKEFEVLAVPDITPRLLREWTELAERATERNPFAEPAFARPALEHLGRNSAGVLLVRRHGKAVALLPVATRRRWRRLPVPAAAAWRHDHCYLGVPLIDRTDEDHAARLLLDAMLRLAGRPGAAVLEWILPEGPAGRVLVDVARAQGFPLVWWDRFERAALLQSPTPIAARSDHQHRRLRRKSRALARDLGEVAVCDRAHDDSAVEEFLRMEASSWKGRASTALGSSTSGAAFFRTMCAASRAAGQLELLTLEAAGRTLAMACNLRAGDGIYHFKSAFDEGAARYSPGALLMLAVRDGFDDEAAQVRDSCTDPGSPLFDELWPDRIEVSTLVIPSGPGARTALTPLLASRRLLTQLSSSARHAAASSEV